MRRILLVAALAVSGLSSVAAAEGKRIGVAWGDFNQPRWKFDAAAMRSAIQRDGNVYVTTNAEASAEKQNDDIRNMIADGIDALVIQPVDKESVLAAVEMAAEAGIPMIAYDRLIEDERVFYLTFDNVGVGRTIAAVVRSVTPEGNYAIIMGDPSDANTGFLRRGMDEVIGAAVAGGTIKIVGEANVDDWTYDGALAAMEQILRDNDNKVDAVLAQNDGMAGAVAEALAAQGLNVPVGGQDGDPGAINRIARGTQTVSVWKNNVELGKTAGHIAGLLADGVPMNRVPDSVTFRDGEKGIPVSAVLLTPTAITKETLNLVIDADVISKKKACEGAMPDVPACQ